MIIDRIEHYSFYTGLRDRIRTALEYIRTTDLERADTGRHDLDGDHLFAIISDYKTTSREAGKLEGHRKYIDVQYMVRGTEWVGHAPLSGQSVAVDYNPGNDCVLFEGEATFFRFEAGMFAVFFPHDLHLPGTGEISTPVRKIVVKVEV